MPAHLLPAGEDDDRAGTFRSGAPGFGGGRAGPSGAVGAVGHAGGRGRNRWNDQPPRGGGQQGGGGAAAAVAAAQAAIAPWRGQAGQQPHPEPQQPQSLQQQPQQRPAKQQKAWVKDGRVYNYPKEGAAQVPP